MIRRSRIYKVGIHVSLAVAFVASAFVQPAEARRRHHYHRHVYARAVPPLAPSESPIPARLDGYAAGVFETGIPGASAADPYEGTGHRYRYRPGYGYIGPGYDGPGFGSPGF